MSARGGAGLAARSREGSPGAGGFAPSALGTREHWDAVYERELHTFQEYGDTGEIWFGEESVNRLLRWMQKHKIPLDAAVLDIGTGNGVLLVELVGTFSIPVLQPNFKMKLRKLVIKDTNHLSSSRKASMPPTLKVTRDGEKELHGKLRGLSLVMALPSTALTSTKPLDFSGLQFFPKDCDVVIPAGSF